MYKEAGEYVVTLTVYGADGNSSSTKRTIVVKAANLGALGILHVYSGNGGCGYRSNLYRHIGRFRWRDRRPPVDPSR